MQVGYAPLSEDPSRLGRVFSLEEILLTGRESLGCMECVGRCEISALDLMPLFHLVPPAHTCAILKLMKVTLPCSRLRKSFEANA